MTQSEETLKYATTSTVLFACVINLLGEFKNNLGVDLFTFQKYVTKTILLFDDNIVLIQIYHNVFTIDTFDLVYKFRKE